MSWYLRAQEEPDILDDSVNQVGYEIAVRSLILEKLKQSNDVPPDEPRWAAAVDACVSWTVQAISMGMNVPLGEPVDITDSGFVFDTLLPDMPCMFRVAMSIDDPGVVASMLVRSGGWTEHKIYTVCYVISSNSGIPTAKSMEVAGGYDQLLGATDGRLATLLIPESAKRLAKFLRD